MIQIEFIEKFEIFIKSIKLKRTNEEETKWILKRLIKA